MTSHVHHGDTNHQHYHCLNHGFRSKWNKKQSSASLNFVRGIHRCPADSPHKGENVSISWRHHEDRNGEGTWHHTIIYNWILYSIICIQLLSNDKSEFVKSHRLVDSKSAIPTDKVASKLSKYSGTINKLKNYLPLQILKALYNSPVQPHLIYAILNSMVVQMQPNGQIKKVTGQNNHTQ